MVGTGVLVLVAVGVSVGGTVSVLVAVGMSVGVSVGGTVSVLVAVGVSVGSPVGVSVGTGVSVGVSVTVGVGVEVYVSVGVPVSVGVFVMVGVAVSGGKHGMTFSHSQAGSFWATSMASSRDPLSLVRNVNVCGPAVRSNTTGNPEITSLTLTQVHPIRGKSHSISGPPSYEKKNELLKESGPHARAQTTYWSS